MTNKFAAVAQQLAQTVDMTATTTGGGAFIKPLVKLFDDGVIKHRMTPLVVRFKAYIELDNQTSTGKFAKDIDRVRVGFEVVSKRHTIDKDGKEIRDSIEFEINKSMNEGGSFIKLFKAMDYGRGMPNFPSMLGEAFITQVDINIRGEGKDRQVYFNIVGKDFCLISAPYREDMDTGETLPVPAPELQANLQCFVWDYPSADQWDSIFIDGTKDDGTSKNWIQNKILSANNIDGSPLQQFLAGGDALPEPGVKTTAASVNNAMNDL